MKKKITKEACKTILYLFSLLFFMPLGQAQQKAYSEIYEKSFSGIKSLEVSHRRGDIEVLPASGQQLSYRIELAFEAQEEEDAQELIRHFKIDTDKLGSELSLSTELNIKKWNSRNGRVRIQFKDGVKVSGIKDVKIKMQLFVPALDLLDLKNKYDDILIEQPLNSELKVNLYSGRLNAAQINNNLTLELKYGKAQIGDFKNGKINVYDSNIKLGNGLKVSLESKYSEIEIGNLSSLNADLYDDELSVQNIQGELVLLDKYSDVKIAGAGNARLDIYDTELQLDKGKNIQVKSKYSDCRFGHLTTLDFELSYDDEIQVKEVDELSSPESKYSDYNILLLHKTVQFDSHDDNINIQSVSKSFAGLTIKGKYTDLDVKLDPSVKFRVESYKKYGKFRFPEDRFEARIYKEKNDELELKGAIKGAASDSPLVKIDAYDCNIHIQ